MRRTNELENRLVEWADEFRGSRFEYLGYPSATWLHNAIVFQGPQPQGLNPRNLRERTPAEEVESAVLALERQEDGYRPARILRCEYFMRSAALDSKMHALSRAGMRVSRTLFFDELWVARTHVAAWLHIPASVELPVAG